MAASKVLVLKVRAVVEEEVRMALTFFDCFEAGHC
jgi:hypothetical protein